MTDLNEIEAKIAAIEKEMRETPYHKATEHHIGRMRAKLSKLTAKATSIKKSGGGFGFAVKKFGDATVVLVGPPSVGKSTLLNKLTAANSRVAAWPFTTVTVVPGMFDYKGAQIQIFDLPGIIGGAAKGIGRGKEVLAVAKVADLMLLIVDNKTSGQLNSLLKEIREAEIDLEPLIVFNKMDLVSRLEKKNGIIYISADKESGIEELKEAIWQGLGLLRIYLKPKNGRPDMEKPLIMERGSTVADVANKTFPEDAEFEKILLWGKSALFPGQQVSMSHELKDEDVVSFC
jgi:small GTP-binding protein